jgi:hypothetical protein
VPLGDSVVALRRRGRRGSRSIRRVVDGARGLGPSVTLAWAARRATGKLRPSHENSSFTWVIADHRTTTIAWLHNYWSDAYGIDRPQLSAELFDQSGASLACWTVDLEPDETIRIDIRERCRTHAVQLPFEGQLLLRLVDDKLMAGRPVQVFAEYERDDGESTGVHGQYGEMEMPAAQVVSTMRVEGQRGNRTAVIVMNPYNGPGGLTPMRAELSVLSADGRHQRARLPALAPRATRRVYVDEVFPDLARFLGDAPGHLRLKLPCPSSRVSTLVEYDDGRCIANHGTVDRVFDQGAGRPAESVEAGPVASAFVICDDRWETELTFPNVWGPVAGAYEAQIDVFASDGAHLVAHTVRVPRDGLVQVAMTPVLRDAGVPLPVVAHAQVSVRPATAVDEWPATFDMLVGLLRDNELVGEVQVGSDFYNGPVPAGVRWPDIRRTRVFGRVRIDRGRRTRVFLSHPVAGTDHGAPARPQLTLVSSDGTRKLTHEVELPAHGCLLAEVTDLFPEAPEFLGGSGSGTLRVRDTGARLYGFYYVESDRARTVPVCHLIGG